MHVGRRLGMWKALVQADFEQLALRVSFRVKMSRCIILQSSFIYVACCIHIAAAFLLVLSRDSSLALLVSNWNQFLMIVCILGIANCPSPSGVAVQSGDLVNNVGQPSSCTEAAATENWIIGLIVAHVKVFRVNCCTGRCTFPNKN